MSKNIILCADGTGNRGGTTPDSNVYRIYQALQLHCEPNASTGGTKQISFYDNGVGTATNKYIKAVTGAFGFGFARNIKDLYTYLARMYEPGDNVFLFGFSRGAAEVRALNGMIAAVGVVDGRTLRDNALEQRVTTEFENYKKNPQRSDLLDPQEGTNHGSIPIAFIGVWDTVSALGFPQKWPKQTLFLRFFSFLFNLLDRLTDRIGGLEHRFYNYELTPNVLKACHALAIDDQRLSFHPLVWNETDASITKTEVSQVWFPGMHSNVGGGYGRTELSYVALKWMLAHAQKAGMEVCDGFNDEVNDKANAEGIMHNSRDGLGVFYRYTPRNLTELSQGKCRGAIKVHDSAVRRMRDRIQWYAPDALPPSFEIIETGPAGDQVVKQASLKKSEYDQAHQAITPVQSKRIRLYSWFLELVLIIIIGAIVCWAPNLIKSYLPARVVALAEPLKNGIQRIDSSLNASALEPVFRVVTGFTRILADLIEFLTPAMFDNFFHLILIRYPFLGLGLIVLIFAMNKRKGSLRNQDQELRAALRDKWNALKLLG